jgi:hypothetical protein
MQPVIKEQNAKFNKLQGDESNHFEINSIVST